MDMPGSTAYVYLLITTFAAWVIAMAFWVTRGRAVHSVRAKLIILLVSLILVLEVFAMIVSWIVSDLVE